MPAKTMMFMPIAWAGVKPALVIAMPTTSAHGISPTESGRKATKPALCTLQPGRVAPG